MAKFLVLIVALAYFLTIRPVIEQNGFNIPDSILNLATGFTPQIQDQTGGTPTNLPNLTPTQINLLKQHPELLRLYGLDPSILNEVQNLQNQPTGSTPSTPVNTLIKAQFQQMIKPYLGYIPAILAALFFVTLYSVVGMILIFSAPLLGFIFWVLEKSGFVKFTTEQREVKKLAV